MVDLAARPAGTVHSADGVPIAYWVFGTGPALVLVHGTTSDHTTFNELVPYLATTRTVITFDRRGRGASGDASTPYEVERELEDAAAVTEETAKRESGPVDVLSHSFGAFLALGAATRTTAVRALVAYSPGFGAEYPPGALARIESATASDDLDTALQVVFREIIGMPDSEIQFMRGSPVWQVRVAAAGTVARECRADEAFLRQYGTRLAALQMPVLVVSGATNTAPKRQIATDLAQLLPHARLVDMPAEGHAAHHTAPAELAKITLRFFDEQSAEGQEPATATGRD